MTGMEDSIRHGSEGDTTVSTFSFKVPDMKARVDALAEATQAFIEAKQAGQADLTSTQKVQASVRSARKKAFEATREGISVEEAEYLDALVKAIDSVETPESAIAPSSAIDRSVGDDLDFDLATMMTLADAGKANMVPEDLMARAREVLSAWRATRPKRGGRGSAGGNSAGAGKGKRFPTPILLTIDGVKLAEEGHNSDQGGPTLGSIGVAALRRWRADHGADPRDDSVKAPDAWKSARRDAFLKVADQDASSAEWQDAEGRVYRIERV